MKKLFFAIIPVVLLISCSKNSTDVNKNSTISYTAGPNLSDINGNVYSSIVTSCGQTWTVQNLNVCQYRNGDEIPNVTDSLQWNNLTTGAWCWYNNDSANYSQYGKLYNWYAINDPRGIAPEGWHIPSSSEWNKLILCIDPNADTSNNLGVNAGIPSDIAGGIMKESGTQHWNSPNSGATNSIGFTGLPGGMRGYQDPFTGVDEQAYWWSATSYDESTALGTGLSSVVASVVRNTIFKNVGFSIRLVK